MIYNPVLLVTVAFFLASICNPARAQDEELANKVFSLRGPALEPRETLEVLKRIIQENPNNYHVRDLLEANDVHSYRKCNTRTFALIDSLIKSNSAFSLSVIPYLKQCRENAIEFCVKTLVSELQLDISRFPELVVPDMTLFREKVLAIDPVEQPLHGIPQKNIEAGSAAFMQQQDPELVAQIKGKSSEQFVERFGEFVGGLCGEVEEAHPGRAISALLQYDDYLLCKRLDEDSLNWLINIKICRFVTENLSSLSMNVYNRLREEQEASESIIKTDTDH